MTLVDLQAGHLDDLLVEDECHGQERECLEPKLQNLISITNGCVTRVDKNVGTDFVRPGLSNGIKF